MFGAVIVSLEDDVPPAVNVGLFEFIWTPNPPAETAAESDTGPVKPFRPVKMTTEPAELPGTSDRELGFETIRKPGEGFTFTSKNIVWVSVPLVPETATV